MTSAAPGVLVRHAYEPRAPRYRKRRELQHEFHIEAADAAMREADAWKWLANRLRPR